MSAVQSSTASYVHLFVFCLLGVVGNPGNLPRDQVTFRMRNINDLVSGKPSNREGLWAMTNKQASGIGHMSNMVLEHVGGAARHCIVCTFFCVSSFLSQVFIRCGLVTAVFWR